MARGGEFAAIVGESKCSKLVVVRSYKSGLALREQLNPDLKPREGMGAQERELAPTNLALGGTWTGNHRIFCAGAQTA